MTGSGSPAAPGQDRPGVLRPALAVAGPSAPGGRSGAGHPAQGRQAAVQVGGPVLPPGRRLGVVGQWLLLTRRSLDLLTRSRLTLAILLGSPLVIILMFLMMFRPGAFDFALTVGVFDSQIEYTTTLVRNPLGDEPGVNTADMHKASRAWSNARNLCTGKQLTSRICCFDLRH